MPWKKTFDLDQAIDRATMVFWAKGYQSTSLADLLQAIGINKGSFYNAFGSKKQLFIQSLLQYDRQQRQQTLATLDALQDPVAAIGDFFEHLIQQSLSDPEKKGCFLVNTALDLPNHEADVQVAVQTAMDDIEAFFRRQLRLGMAHGRIPTTVNASECAKALLALLVGLRLLSRGIFEREDLMTIKTQALRLLQL